MAYCAPNLISNIRKMLNKRMLNYILISHSHYDHVGGIPYLKREWSDSKVLGADHAKQVLNKTSALKTIRKLSKQAAGFFGADDLKEYDDDLLKVDNSIYDGNILDLGGLQIKVINADIPLWQNFIPLWNGYLVAKQVMSKPLALLVGNLWGKVARKLGKSYSIYSVLGCLNLFFLIMPIMAFDSSYPIDSKER